ncbi:hypothetical protein ES711_04795 [Gelidibacter salicanalis]|uniref:Porin family protein n=1 Tax=Gelidibacter salicanalis TaxID=291193 RepID=A0A5C7ANJ8_9FLAO|nr:hypothetical protein [Gelidibacter salicanalis]TXE09249.1 hypothetical protein ES711_04795 [Gelidibacter salicanalis]
MKKLLIILLVTTFGYNAQAQEFEDSWQINAGFNTVGNLGTQNPLERLDEFGFRNPFIIGIEYRWAQEFSIEQDFSLNGFKKGVYLNDGILTDNLTYFSTNTTVKWFFSDYIYNLDELELYIGGGVGLFHMDELNTSGNLSGGIQYWINDNLGIRLQAIGKFAVNHKDRQYANNHWQHALQVVYKL